MTEMNWRPIETAPKTGSSMVATCILAYCPEEQERDRIRVLWWEPQMRGGAWYDGRNITDKDQLVRPTHWMPLPQPPET